MLRRRFGTDRRVRFLADTDGLSWVEHYNLLLREARGKYALWFPHDDSYPSSYIRELVSALERRPDAVLAFGRVERISLDGFLPTRPFSPPPVSADADWSLGGSIRMLTLWQLWIAFRGMVRREIVQHAGLYLRPTYGNVRADIYWVFALSLRGRLLFVPSCSCTKRFHRSSTGAEWRVGLRQSVDACRVLRSYLNDHARSRRDAVLGQLAVFPWCLAQAGCRAAWRDDCGISTSARRALARRWWMDRVRRLDGPATGPDRRAIVPPGRYFTRRRRPEGCAGAVVRQPW